MDTIAPITVVVPVGPLPRHSEYLIECLESVRDQTVKPAELLVIDNGAGVLETGVFDCPCTAGLPVANVYRLRENIGISGGFNAGVEYAQNELILFLASDDLLKPEAVRRSWQAWNHYGQKLGWYFLGVEYSNGFSQNTPCLAAMVSKELWRVAGPLAADGTHTYPGCEVEYISRMILAHGRFGASYRVSDDVLYWHRIHTPGSVGMPGPQGVEPQ